jgi:hypothetical protein
MGEAIDRSSSTVDVLTSQSTHELDEESYAQSFRLLSVKTIQAYQIVPDEAHWTIDVLDMTQPLSPVLAPAWRWLHEEWTYPVPKKSVAVTDLGVLRGERITEVMRWEEDEWKIFAGARPDIPETEKRVVPLGILLAADSPLVPAVDLPIGAGFWRDAESEWHPWGKPGGTAGA